MILSVSSDIELRQLSESNSSALFALTDKNRAYLSNWMPWLNMTRKEDDSLAFIEMTLKQYEQGLGLQMGIWFSERLVGVIGHHSLSEANKSVSLGYWLGQDFQGKGIMTRSLEKMLHLSFVELDMYLVQIAAASENLRSRRVAEKLGFKFEGILRQREWLYDHYVDHAIYSLLHSEWLKIKKT